MPLSWIQKSHLLSCAWVKLDHETQFPARSNMCWLKCIFNGVTNGRRSWFRLMRPLHLVGKVRRQLLGDESVRISYFTWEWSPAGFELTSLWLSSPGSSGWSTMEHCQHFLSLPTWQIEIGLSFSSAILPLLQSILPTSFFFWCPSSSFLVPWFSVLVLLLLQSAFSKSLLVVWFFLLLAPYQSVPWSCSPFCSCPSSSPVGPFKEPLGRSSPYPSLVGVLSKRSLVVWFFLSLRCSYKSFNILFSYLTFSLHPFFINLGSSWCLSCSRLVQFLSSSLQAQINSHGNISQIDCYCWIENLFLSSRLHLHSRCCESLFPS